MPDSNGRWIVSPDETVLVTGAGGFIGSRVVHILLEYGFQHIRCFVRPSSNMTRLRAVIAAHDAARRVEVLEGNLLTQEDCARAAKSATVVFHLAAGVDKSFAGCFMNSVLTTRNLLDGVVSEKVLKRFVNVSSFAVYSNLEMKRGSLLDETAPLETDPVRRHDPYGYGKLKQEQIVERYHKSFGVPYVVLRPGAVYGPGKSNLSGRIGIDTFGVFLHMGGSKPVPLTFVDNCAEAVVLAGLVDGVDGQVFNVVDDEQPSSGHFLRLYKKHVGRFFSITVPYRLAYWLCAAWEDYAARTQGQLPPRFNRRRCSAEWKGNRYSNEKLKQLLGWRPRVGFEQGSQLLFDSLRGVSS
jgi:nucleoside-diphosphate-sugar epimerase